MVKLFFLNLLNLLPRKKCSSFLFNLFLSDFALVFDMDFAAAVFAEVEITGELKLKSNSLD